MRRDRDVAERTQAGSPAGELAALDVWTAVITCCDHAGVDVDGHAALPGRAVPAGEVVKRVAVVIGTRAEAVKCALVVRELQSLPGVRPWVIATGQHEGAALEALALFGVRVDEALDPPAAGISLAARTAAVQMALAPVLIAGRFDQVLVHGDTVSALAGALTGFLAGIPVVHLEAGLRTHDLSSPFPEEGNRVVISRVAALHLAPTLRAAAHLTSEGIAAGRVVVTGNTAIDAVLHAAALPPQPSTGAGSASAHGWAEFARRPGRLVLAGAHRRESWGRPLERIRDAIGRLAVLHPTVNFLVPAHMNPHVQDLWRAGLPARDNLHLTGPIEYAAFARLLATADLVITDSGGLQEEAAAFGVPVLVTREKTERTEGLRAGCARLVGTDTDGIIKEACIALARPWADSTPNPYGDGRAAGRAAAACAWFLGLGPSPDSWPG
ncbi:UDP-N-acetylglucosamine 2-epimerase (non-hydrolyzing) [Streptomyces sp. NPDC046161]|uniref:non-hydrolyzing UDP-N-acetylglucosamine 2-epimerase n=1 Tax=Streptomyces sp. NPDC046161 TaxID=3155132 RepID=UPI0033EE6B54